MRCEEKNTVNKIEENEPEKLKNKVLITDYAKVKKKNAEQNGCSHTQTMIGTLFRHLNEQGYNSMITTGDFKSCTLFVALFESFVERRPLLKHPCDDLFLFFYLSSKRNRKFNIWSKLN